MEPLGQRPTLLQRGAWAAWVALLAIVGTVVALGSDRTVTTVYWQAGADWLAGHPLYAGTGHGFIYLPHTAVAFVPFSALAFPMADIVWRAITIGTYACGVSRIAHLAGGLRGPAFFAVMTALCLPPSFDAARNGQATLAAAGLMVLALSDLSGGRWRRATTWLCLGIVLKPLGATLIPLVMLLYAPVRRPLLAGLVLTAAMPFAAQRFEYVLRQYEGYGATLTAGATLGAAEAWANVFNLLDMIGVDTSAPIRLALIVAAVALVASACLYSARHHSAPEAAVWIYTLHACGLMLFSPRTENNTYAVLAPAIAVLCARALLRDRRLIAATALASACVLTTASYELGRRLVPDRAPTWLAPLVAVGVAAYAATQLRRDSGEPR